MKLSKEHLPLGHRLNHWLKVVIGYCLVVLFGSTFIVEQASASTGIAYESGICQGYTLFNNADLPGDERQPIQLPAESAPSRSESELSDESPDDFDEDLNNLFAEVFGQAKLTIHAEKALFSQLLLSIEGRSKISLIILYHSWKCFLNS